ncbi:MAG: hypothetical protein A3K31_15280 [Ignavibacteria bacterium RIFOXYA12_FULL_35_25]|nr:MAG: hypothetical protein A2X60_03645 [Ignavibacteria bacterium GWF2_35_20]OGU85598.1 MAG: hypothetical protein A3K31_15280 [Ignavibacteria bacterium RIFOXYA12_FULL_35_25]OGU96305.1 MAG: hypothetical protein A2347_01990 [Ignavibacteria bacterium RIFOXYB12_FULL_35_14]OGV31621.1 MAG: hypothetical protein A2523_11750 [Ignavibacteria bacterium RIFOXYD12_FULL_36_8]
MKLSKNPTAIFKLSHKGIAKPHGVNYDSEVFASLSNKHAFPTKNLWIFAIVFTFNFVLSQSSVCQTDNANRLREELPSLTLQKLISAPGYCESTGGSTTFESISSVHVIEKPGNLLDITVDVYIANPTGCQSGEPCPVYDTNPEFVNVWIDWNGNNVWEPHEKVLDAALTSYNINYGKTMTAKASVEIPSSAVRPTWLRANLGWGYDPENPCQASWSYGNVVDQQVLWNMKVKKIAATLNIDLIDVSKPLWQAAYNEFGNMIGLISNPPVAAGMKNGWFTLPIELVSFPENLGADSRTDCNWEILGTGANGLAGITGKNGVISITLPQKIGIYDLQLKFLFKNNKGNRIGEQIITLSLWVSYNTPKLSSTKKIWLKKAIDWTVGSQMGTNIEDELAMNIMNGIHSKSGWRYINGGNKWFELVEGLSDWGNCRNMAVVWNNLLLVLGVDAGSQAGHEGRKGKGFMSTTGLISFGALASSKGNARGLIDPTFDRWVFGSHWFGKLGNKYYDPVFNITGSDLFYHDAYDIESIEGNTSTTDGGPTLYNWEANFTFDEGNWPKYRYTPIINKSLAVDDMQTDGARFTGSYSELPIDSDGDGIFNQLGATVGVEITIPGMYRVTGVLQKGDTLITSRSAFTDPSIWSETFGPQMGNYEVNPVFSGEEIFNITQNGPYEMSLIIMDSTGVIAAADTFSSAPYDFSNFGEFPLRLNQVTETAQDTNSDSYFDEILVSLSLLTNQPMLYTVNISLLHSDQTLVSANQTIAVPIGSNSLDLYLPAQNIAASGLDGPYSLIIQVIDPSGEQTIYEEFQTASYLASQFNPPIVKIAGGNSDQGVDINSNGLFDTLIVSVNIEASVAGTYTALAWLMGQNGEDITWAGSKMIFGIGTNSHTFNFPGMEINKSQINGTYKIGYAVITDDSANLIFSSADIYTTQNYSVSQFEVSNAQIISSTGNYSESSIDTDSDGLIDTLVVKVEVVSRDSGNVVALGRLVDSENETILWSSITEFFQENYPQFLNLKFDGRYIYGGLVDGPYQLKDLQIYHIGDPSLTVDLQAPYTTQNYNYTDFEKTGVITGTISDVNNNPVQSAFLIISDNDNDYSNNMGKYNLVLLNKGEFDLRIEGPDSLDIEWSIDLNGNFLTIGDSVRVFVDSNQIVNVDFRAPIVISEVKNLYSEIIPDKYFLEQNYPNPFNPSTTIRYAIPLLGGDERGGFITMKVYDVLGNEVANLINEEKPVGSYAVDFDASKLSSGIYFYRLQVYPAEGGVVKFVETRKMILTK